MITKVNYIVAFYIGPLRTYPKYQAMFKEEPLFFVRKHIDFLEKSNSIERATFVFNDDIHDDLKQQILALTISNVELKIVFRVNSGFSYGAWDEAIVASIDEDYDYYFLIEDDYIPARLDFIDKHLEFMTEDTAFVCGLVEIATKERFPQLVDKGDTFPFPSISNGLLSTQACKTILKTNSNVFRLKNNPDANYQTGYINQIYFCKYFTDAGYNVVDILSRYTSPYMDARGDNIRLYGDINNQPLLIPIHIPYA